MTTDTTDRQLVRVVISIAAGLVVLPVLGMWSGTMGTGPMMGGMSSDHMWGGGGASGWMLVVGAGMRLLFFAVVVGAAYLGYRALAERDEPSDPALEELRAAYARGDLSDDEYERRRERLEPEP